MIDQAAPLFASQPTVHHIAQLSPQLRQTAERLTHCGGLTPTFRQNPLRWTFNRLYSLWLIAALLGLLLVSSMKQTSEWDDVYLGTARALLNGHDLYLPAHPLSAVSNVSASEQEREDLDVAQNTYPPFSSVVSIPLTFLPPRVARVIWAVICLGCFAYFFRVCWRLSGGPKLENNPYAGVSEHVVFWAGIVIALQFSLNAISHLQTDLPIAALLSAGLLALSQQKYLRSALWIGLAAAFKATPLLFVPYMLYRRQLRAAALMVSVTIAANLLPDLIHRPSDGSIWMVHWFRHYVSPIGQNDYTPGNWKNLLDNNQSLFGLSRRWFTTSWRDNPESAMPVAHHDQPSPATLRLILLSMVAMVIGPVLWAGWRGRRDAWTPRPPPADFSFGGRVMFECGAVMMLMLLLSPNSSRAHFCIMLLPAWCCARTAMAGGSAIRILTLAAMIFSTLSIHLRLDSTHLAEHLMLWGGVVTLAAIALLFACTTGATRFVANGTLAATPDAIG